MTGEVDPVADRLRDRLRFSPADMAAEDERVAGRLETLMVEAVQAVEARVRGRLTEYVRSALAADGGVVSPDRAAVAAVDAVARFYAECVGAPAPWVAPASSGGFVVAGDWVGDPVADSWRAMFDSFPMPDLGGLPGAEGDGGG